MLTIAFVSWNTDNMLGFGNSAAGSSVRFLVLEFETITGEIPHSLYLLLTVSENVVGGRCTADLSPAYRRCSRFLYRFEMVKKLARAKLSREFQRVVGRG